MTKLKKSVLAYLAAIILTATLLAGVFMLSGTGVNTADAATVTSVGQDDLLIEDDGEHVVLKGFKSGVNLPEKYELVVPENVTAIESYAFNADSGLVRVVLNAKQEIGTGAFLDCTSLVEVVNTPGWELQHSGTDYGRISYYALSIVNTAAQSNITVDGNGYMFCEDVLGESGNYLIGYVGTATELTLPDGDYELFDYAFNGMTGVTTVDASAAKFTTVSAYCFADSTALKSVILPASVTAISYGAFMNCTALEEVNLPENLATIGDRAFNGCSSLVGDKTAGTLKFPASLTSIGQLAFYDCKALTGLEFAKSEEVELTLNRQAFMNCTSLSIVELPVQLKTMYLQVFYGCTGLQYAYVPDGVTFTARLAPGDNTVYFDTNTWLVFNNYGEYNTAKTGTYIKNHAAKMTYLVEVEYSDGHSSIESEYRLAYRDFNLVQSADKGWNTVASYLPVQDGYASSVWYTDEAKSTAANISNLNGLLKNNSDKLTLYATYTEKPEVTVNSVDYDPANTTGFNTGDFGVELDSSQYSCAFDTPSVIDAGNYQLTVSLADGLGVWAENIVRTVTVNKLSVDLAATAVWQVQGGSSLGDNVIYEYRNGGTTKYSLSAEVPAGFTLYSVHDLKNSVTGYVNSAIVAVLATNGAYKNVTYSNNSATNEGKYTSTATLTANDNYLFYNGGGAYETTNATIGMTVTVNADGTSATLTKSWYIIQALNRLFADGSMTNLYIMNGWQYNDGSATLPTAPVFEHSDGNAVSGTTFELRLNGAAINEAANLTDFGDYFNLSMPAGVYTVRFKLPNIVDGGTTYYGYTTDPYTFTVEEADFDAVWAADAKAKLVTADFRYGANIVQLYNKNATGALNPNLSIWSATLNPTRTGEWAKSDYNTYYSESFELTYNVLGMTTLKYWSYTDLVNRNDLVKPLNPGVYTVFYQLSANNYKPLVDVSNDAQRAEYSYKVTVYDEISAPSVAANIKFALGGATLYVAAGENYTISYVCNNHTANVPVYDSVGDYTVTFTLTDTENYVYRWAGLNGAKTASITRTFTVDPAENEITVHLSLTAWNYGNYDSDDKHEPLFGVTYSDGTDDFYTYTLTAKTGGKVYTYGAEGESGFKYAPVGKYVLRAQTKALGNWAANYEEIEFEILKGYISWEVTPSVMQWTYKSFDKNVNHILGSVDLPDVEIVFNVYEDEECEKVVEGLEGFYTTDGVVRLELVAKHLRDLHFGTYYLKATVAETDSYFKLESVTPFAVAKAVNYFDEAPVVDAWIVGKYDPEVNRISATAHFGTKVNYVITVAGDASDIVYDSAKGVNRLADAKVGLYELKAYVEGTADYDAIDGYSVIFNVFEKAGLPWWVTLIIVLVVLIIVAVVFYILHEKGILQMFTGKLVLAVRTKMTVDATIAAVRANKVAAESRKSIAKARLQDANEARRRKLEELRNMPPDERAAALDEQAREVAENADKLDRKAERISKRAERIRKQARDQSTAADAGESTDNNENNDNNPQ